MTPPPEFSIVGSSPALRRVAALAQRFARSDLPVLLVGETGTGKELFAQAIHRWSGRSGELVDVNCGALPAEMVESLLFGHRRGAFTGATEMAEGLVTAADRGTLFLDEVTSLSLEAQAKLLRVLETREVRPLGGTRKRAIDLRVVAAAQVELRERVECGGFRTDLYQRLAGIVLELPPLRERPEDITPLVAHFAARSGRSVSREADRAARAHPWPGNARELRLSIERAAWLSSEDVLSAETLEESIRLGAGAIGPPSLGSERDRIVGACREAGWNVPAAARALGVGRTTLYTRLREFGIPIPASGSSSSSGRAPIGPDGIRASPIRPRTEVAVS